MARAKIDGNNGKYSPKFRACDRRKYVSAIYIRSKELSAQELHDATRSHWQIESMHWVLDTAFKEDACRIRADDRAEAFARIRLVCLNLLKNEKWFKGGIKRKRMQCTMDENYLSKVLEASKDGDVHAFSVDACRIRANDHAEAFAVEHGNR